MPSWQTAQAQRAIMAAKRRLGAAWDLVGPEIREAMVCRELVVALAAQDESVWGTSIAKWVQLANQALQREDDTP